MPKTIFTGANKVVVDAVREARLEMGMTQAELGHAIGKDQSHISLIENSQRRLDVTEFRQVAQALGRDPTKFFQDICERLERQGL